MVTKKKVDVAKKAEAKSEPVSSLPTRGAWIETIPVDRDIEGLSPRMAAIGSRKFFDLLKLPEADKDEIDE